MIVWVPDMMIETSDIIGIDYGERYIGIARVSPVVRIAEPLETFQGDRESLFVALQKYIDEYSAERIVVGVPRGLDGQETMQTKICRDFAAEVSVKFPNISTYIIDEAGTSEEAKDRKGSGDPAGIDAIAAGILSEDFLSLDENQKQLISI